MLRNWLDERAHIVDVRKRFSPDIRRALVIHLIDFIIQLYERQKKNSRIQMNEPPRHKARSDRELGPRNFLVLICLNFYLLYVW